MIGRIWVTRKDPFVDWIACGWLIRRFVNETAVFKYVDSNAYNLAPGELRFDMFEGEYTHEGNRCTFEIIHDIELKESQYKRSEMDGLNAMLVGLAALEYNDEKRMTQVALLIDNLYAFLKSQKVN